MTAIWEDDLRRVRILVELWEAGSSELPKDVSTNDAYIYRETFDRFSYQAFKSDLDRFSNGIEKGNWTEIGGFLRASPVVVGHPPTLFPLVKFVVRVVGDQAEIMVRLATYFVNETESSIDQELYGSLDAHGWRFETADTPGSGAGDGTGEGFHHYPHAQPITAWDKGGPGLFLRQRREPLAYELRLVAPKWNESRPAFPLGCNTPAGVVVAAMTSLYGAARTGRMLEKAPNDVELKREISSVLRYSTL